MPSPKHVEAIHLTIGECGVLRANLAKAGFGTSKPPGIVATLWDKVDAAYQRHEQRIKSRKGAATRRRRERKLLEGDRQ